MYYVRVTKCVRNTKVELLYSTKNISRKIKTSRAWAASGKKNCVSDTILKYLPYHISQCAGVENIEKSLMKTWQALHDEGGREGKLEYFLIYCSTIKLLPSSLPLQYS